MTPVEIQQIARWLTDHGFRVVSVPQAQPLRLVIEVNDATAAEEARDQPGGRTEGQP
jgi:hypothetical protein